MMPPNNPPLPFPNPLEPILTQAKAAVGAGLYFPTLFTILTLPDICGALESAGKEKSKARYIAWVDTHLPPYGGDNLYQFRCCLLHEAMATTPEAPAVDRYFFLGPGQSVGIHRIGLSQFGSRTAVAIDLAQFVDEVSAAVWSWFEAVPKTRDFYLRLYETIQRRQGLPGLIAGATVIG